MLVLIRAIFSKGSETASRASWRAALMLFVYAIAFSFAYISLNTGTGALILFGAVQLTMIVAGLMSGERPRPTEWLGLTVALAGLVYLVFPGLTAPSPLGSVLMAIAGIAWGFYSLLGRGSTNPLADTTNNFVRTLPFAAVLSLVMLSDLSASGKGVLLAVLSGALASGIGYVIWYAALRGLTATRAATVQLAVPVIAAVGGVILLSEDISIRLLVSTILILGGIGLAVSGYRPGTRRTT